MLGQAGMADVATDIAGLNKLKYLAKEDSGKALAETAKQFESLFIQMALKSMRKATPEGGLFNSEQSQTYREMYDQQLSVELAKSGKFGLAQGIMRQIGKQGTEASQHLDGKSLSAYRQSPVFMPNTPRQPGMPMPTAVSYQLRGTIGQYAQPNGYSPNRSGPRTNNTLPSAFNTPDEFVQSLLPHAQAAARDLGVDPKLLLAQAALESGWGKHVIPNRDGTPSHNLFGIKADQSWQGSKVTQQTLEYVGGVAVQRRAAFRAYDNYAESFKDYAAFIKDNPRYSQALNQAHHPEHFIQALQKAGYATDPHYGNKVLSLMRDNDAFS